MYKLTVPFVDYKKRPRNVEVSFNLDAREVFKLLPQLKYVFEWLESHRDAEPRTLTAEEVSAFYTEFENILLEAYGEMTEDGLYFRKGNKYEFEESALFNACMIMFVTKPEETRKLLEGILPADLFDMVKNADANQVADASAAQLAERDAEIQRLKAQIQGNN